MADALRIRRARTEDAAAIAAIYAPYVRDTAISFETEPPDAAAMATRIAATVEGGLPWLVARDDAGQVRGYAYAGRFHARFAYRFTIEPTVYLASGNQGQGVGTRLYGSLLAIVEQLGYRQAIALITLPNPLSVALHERFGFRQTGLYEAAGYKFDTWTDVGTFQKPLGDGNETSPDEPMMLDCSAIWQGLK